MKKGLTHAGKFHADDVFATALLQIIYPEIEIERAFQVPDGYEGIVYDIGLGAYDHHQQDREVRENGIPYAAFGLLWREYGPQLVGEQMAKDMDASFIQLLDESDNTGCKNELAGIIALFNPGWDEEKDTDTCFWEAVSFAKAILERKIAYIKGEERASSILEQAIAQSHDHILQLDQFVPWKKKIVGSDIWFVVYPSKRGGYNAQAVPKDLEHPELVYPFLEDWWGKEGEVLQEISEIKNARFCHASGFLFVADSLDGALEACNYVIRQQKK